jgi:sec-independent protein translocase protein TatA
MGGLSIWHWLLVLGVVLLLFGGGNKLSNVMGDFAKGIKSFKKNMSEENDESMEATAERPTGSIAPPASSTSAKPSPTPVHPS